MPVKLLATADLHLGRETAGLSSSGNKRFPTASTWLTMVEYAVHHRVDALLLAGDIVDHDNKYFEAVSVLERGLKQLAEAKIHVFMTAGNHDFDVLPSIMKTLNNEYVHLLGEGGTWGHKTIALNQQPITFHGWSFPKQHHRNDPVADFYTNQIVAENLNIGLVHGDYNVPKSVYAPLNPSGLNIPGMDLWLLGHIHKQEVFRKERPLIFYPGSPHALSPKEPGKHGAWLISIEDDRSISTSLIPLSPIRFDTLTIDISHLTETDSIRDFVFTTLEQCANTLLEEVAPPEMLVYDIQLTGSFPHLQALESLLDSWMISDFERTISGVHIRVRRVTHRCSIRVSNLNELAKEPSPAGMLAKAIVDIENGTSSELLDALRAELADRLKNMSNHASFRMLNDGEDSDIPELNEDYLNQLLRNECHRMLSELMSRKMEVTS